MWKERMLEVAFLVTYAKNDLAREMTVYRFPAGTITEYGCVLMRTAIYTRIN